MSLSNVNASDVELDTPLEYHENIKNPVELAILRFMESNIAPFQYAANPIEVEFDLFAQKYKGAMNTPFENDKNSSEWPAQRFIEGDNSPLKNDKNFGETSQDFIQYDNASFEYEENRAKMSVGGIIEGDNAPLEEDDNPAILAFPLVTEIDNKSSNKLGYKPSKPRRVYKPKLREANRPPWRLAYRKGNECWPNKGFYEGPLCCAGIYGNKLGVTTYGGSGGSCGSNGGGCCCAAGRKCGEVNKLPTCGVQDTPPAFVCQPSRKNGPVPQTRCCQEVCGLMNNVEFGACSAKTRAMKRPDGPLFGTCHVTNCGTSTTNLPKSKPESMMDKCLQAGILGFGGGMFSKWPPGKEAGTQTQQKQSRPLCTRTQAIT